MTSVSMSEMMTKFKVTVQPHLDKGEDVMVIDKKTGEIKCRICPPVSNENIEVDWERHWGKYQRDPIILKSSFDGDPVAMALSHTRGDSHLL